LVVIVRVEFGEHVSERLRGRIEVGGDELVLVDSLESTLELPVREEPAGDREDDEQGEIAHPTAAEEESPALARCG
jgi:hypothetical protein